MIYTSLLELHRPSWEYDVTQEGCDSSQTCPDTLECLKPRHQRFLSEKLEHVVHNSKPTIDHSIDFQGARQEGKSTRKDKMSLFFPHPQLRGLPCSGHVWLQPGVLRCSQSDCLQERSLAVLTLHCLPNPTAFSCQGGLRTEGSGEDKGTTGKMMHRVVCFHSIWRCLTWKAHKLRMSPELTGS